MSGAMEKLTAALEANTAAMLKMIEMSGGKTSGGSSSGASSSAKGSSGKGSAGKKKETSVDDVAKAFSDYLAVKDNDERSKRKDNVKAIVDYFGAKRATEIDPSNFDEALGYLQQYIDGETPEFAGAEGDEDGALV